MTSPQALPRQAFGRDIRPATGVLAVYTAWVAVLGILGHSLLSTPWADLTGIAGMVAAGALVAGWWAQSTTAMALGLQVAAGVWATLAARLTIEAAVPWWGVSAAGAWAWCAVAVGLWWRDGG